MTFMRLARSLCFMNNYKGNLRFLLFGVKPWSIYLKPVERRCYYDTCKNDHFHVSNWTQFKRTISVSNLENIKCWKCSQNFKAFNLFCANCGSIIESNIVKSYNYFTLLNHKFAFKFNKTELTNNLREIQSKLHPDKTTLKSQREQDFSAELSSIVNKAYDTLSKPLPRGLYMLKLLGKPLEEHSTEMDSDFLMEVMEVNEAISQASYKELEKISIKNLSLLESLFQDVSDAFEKSDITAAHYLLSKINFYNNINEKIKDMSSDL